MPMVVGNNILYLTLDELLGSIDKKLVDGLRETANKGIQRFRKGAGKSWECKYINNVTHINYDSIPEKTKTQYGLPVKEKYIIENAQNKIEESLRLDWKALEYYKSNERSYKDAAELQEIAAWLMLCAPVNRSAARGLGFESVDNFYKEVINLMLSRNYRTWKLTNLDKLKRKISPFYKLVKRFPDVDFIAEKELHEDYKEALETIISKKVGLRNAAKINKDDQQAEEMQARLIQLYSDPRKLTIEQTHLAYLKTSNLKHREYLESEGKSGWDNKCFITTQTISNYLYRPDVQQIWYAKRHGQKAANNIFERNTKRKPASFANAKWVIDGTPWHRYYVHNGYTYQRLNVFVVLDAHSWCVIGFFVSFQEDARQVLGALRAACMVSGHIPHELQSDNSKAIQSWHVQNAVDILSRYNIPTRPGNAKAKMIEPFFSHFNDRILKFRKGYTANPFSKAQDGKINPDHLQQLIKAKQIPTIEQAIAEMKEDFNLWNNHEFNGSTPLEKYRKSMEETREFQREFTEGLDVEAFWITPGKMKQVPASDRQRQKMISVFNPHEYTFTNNGIEVQIDKQKYSFDVPNADFNSKYIGQKFTLKIEPENKSKALLYLDGKPLIENGQHVMALPTHLFANAIVDRQEGEEKLIKEYQDIKKEQKELSKQSFDRFISIAHASGTHEIPMAKDIYDKALVNAQKAEIGERIANGEVKSLPIQEEEIKQPKIDRFAI
jgi:transposase InsO family protein